MLGLDKYYFDCLERVKWKPRTNIMNNSFLITQGCLFLQNE